LRMERLNLRTLSLLQRMVEVAARPGHLEHVPDDSHRDGSSPGGVAAPAASSGDRQRHP